MRQIVKRFKNTPAYAAFKQDTKAVQRWLALPRSVGSTYPCPVCGPGLRPFKPIWKSFVRKLQEHGFEHPLDSLETFNVSAHTCPACDASDRERLYALYLEDRFRALDPAPGPPPPARGLRRLPRPVQAPASAALARLSHRRPLPAGGGRPCGYFGHDD